MGGEQDVALFGTLGAARERGWESRASNCSRARFGKRTPARAKEIHLHFAIPLTLALPMHSANSAPLRPEAEIGSCSTARANRRHSCSEPRSIAVCTATPGHSVTGFAGEISRLQN